MTASPQLRAIQSASPPAKGGRFSNMFAQFANAVAHAAGRPSAFVICCVVIVIWAITGPIFHYSDTWQLIINTGTTIVTFLMVFLIQNTQNRDGLALQAKLDELIRVTQAAHNQLIGIERLPQKELEEIRSEYEAATEPEASPSPSPRSPDPPRNSRSA